MGLSLRLVALVLPRLIVGVQPGDAARTKTLTSANLVRIKGISYGPVPSKTRGEAPDVDDFMARDFEPLWGDGGRGDLGIMRKMGANVVRLYGNDPRQDHQAFLDTAHANGISVIPGMSNYPYTAAPSACSKTGWDCYDQLKDQYADNLRNGFAKGGKYHPALAYVIIINEPDYKAPGLDQPKLFCKAIISAFDGMLTAEEDAGIKDSEVKFTATFSFGVCSHCARYNTKPALGQMYDLRAAMLDPSIVGYKAKNDLAKAYHTRFVHSFNTPSPASVVQKEFLDLYKSEFKEPFFIGEYHCPTVDQAEDLKDAMQLAADHSSQFLGISYFEFQIAYWKGGSELEFGMLGLGDVSFEKFDAFGSSWDAWCLDGNIVDPHAKTKGNTIAQAVIDAYGGQGVDWQKLCLYDPQKVPVTGQGFEEIQKQRSTAQMSTFVSRTVGHMGGKVTSLDGCDSFAARYSGQEQKPAGDFAQLAGELGSYPQWAAWDRVSAACVAEKSASPRKLGEAVSYACGHVQKMDCKKIPAKCTSSLRTQADYILSFFYNEMSSHLGPLDGCNFDGAAIYSPREDYAPRDPDCVVNRDPETTAMTQEGYIVIVGDGASKVASFVRRILLEQLGEQVADDDQLQLLAANVSGSLPGDLASLEKLLQTVPWTCGGKSNRDCPGGSPVGSIMLVILAILAGISAVALVILGVQRICRRRRLQNTRLQSALEAVRTSARPAA